MNAKKIIIAGTLLLSATSAALAQSAWTTGTAADRARAGYTSPYGGSGLYAYASVSRHANGLQAYAMVPHAQDGQPGSIDDPALTGGGAPGYNDSLRHDW